MSMKAGCHFLKKVHEKRGLVACDVIEAGRDC